jgi:hypothetical protein
MGIEDVSAAQIPAANATNEGRYMRMAMTNCCSLLPKWLQAAMDVGIGA